MNAPNMPPGWEPPAPAWREVWRNTTEPLVAAYFGVQGEDSSALIGWGEKALTGEHGAELVERGVFIDKTGTSNSLYIAYWRESRYREWWADEDRGGWWRQPQRVEDHVGYWRETVVMPAERLETLHSTPSPHGVARLADQITGPIAEHGYAGAMRDRIPLSASDPLKGLQMDARLESTTLAEGRVRIKSPVNLCVIRSGQDWCLCRGEEREDYLGNVHPVLKKGMDYLRDNPRESGCYAMRLVDRMDENWRPVDESFGLGYACDIYAFENWAKSHPTHLAIFGSFMEMVQKYGENMQLQLWHEVTVPAAGSCEFEYINCHRNTGLLPYC